MASEITIATLPRITSQSLKSLLTSPATATSTAVIDVRDSDHIGGHIRNSQHIPTGTHDYRMPELVRTLSDKKVVVFHCMLSQQRGPASALRYVRERERLLGLEKGKCMREGGNENENENEIEEQDAQRVVVLEGGFGKWQQLYGEDERVTEDYQKELWDEGFD